MKKKTKKICGILLIAVVLSVVAAVIYSCVINNQKHSVQIGMQSDKNSDNEQGNKNNDEKNDTSKEEVELDNGGYLTLENDPNAEDAAVVAENLKGLLKGIKTFPVRTDGKKVVYLTFDDGPSTTNTPEILNILDKYNVKATFFILGKSLEANEQAKELLKEEAKRGHAIANHTYGHDYKNLYPNRVMSVENIISDFNKNENMMKEILGQDFSTRVVRFPGGYWSWEGRTAMKEEMDKSELYSVDWNALNKDAEGKKKNADELVQSAKETTEALGPNADSIVLLMHDTYGKEETVKALPQIIEYFQSKGFEFKTIK